MGVVVMLEWSESDLLVRDTVREYLEKEVRPRLDELEHGDLPPYDLIRGLWRSFGIDALARETFAGMLAAERSRSRGERRTGGPTGIGGAEQAGMIMLAVAEICRMSMGMVSTVGVSLGLCAGTIMSRGTPEQKERWLLDLLTFDKVGAWAITEPDAGSDAFGGMKTTVTPRGDGYLLKGQKTFITNGPDADTLVVYAKLDDGTGVPPRGRPVLAFVLDRGMDGLTQSRPFRKMGMHSSRTGALFFDDVFLEPDRLLGGIGGLSDGRASARANFTMERLGVGAMSLGVIEECLRLSVDYARTRELWGQKIAEFQLIQLKLARMEVARLNVQNMVFRAVEQLRAGRQPTLAEASAVKLYCSEAAAEVAMEAVQLFGGNGYMSEYRVEQLARDAKSLMIYAGSNEVQVTHIAKDLLTR
ncbi:acyl-CoA dehydrogenase family protein [Actinocorallia sp. B10E7]|uniref:acyl-CoA dehydrogenase family protein n=1 Tax=Actinocorallia sp. B10E7 TaxID=3153558 RepID=UPI00325D2998